MTTVVTPTAMDDLALAPLPHSLDHECPVSWPLSDDYINQEYPFFSIDEESPEDFVIRRYLETLWLPESTMLLQHFVKSLRRLTPSPTCAQSQHTVLKPLLLSVRGTQTKYHRELPQILRDGGGAGEIEETVMWYAWSREKFEWDKRGESSGTSGKDAEEEWKKSWMEKMERREVQLQILLYFHLLSLPSPRQSTPVASQPRKRKRKHMHGPPSPVKQVFPPTSSVEAAVSTTPSATKALTTDIDERLTMEDRLEFFMDRLSLWQMVASLNPTDSSPPTLFRPQLKDPRDWMQVFCEDIVEPLFRRQLPELCDLLRTKVFPHSPFSEDSDNPTQPLPRLMGKKRKIKGKRPESPLRLQELERRKQTQSRAASTQSTAGSMGSLEAGVPHRHRSRSRTVSVSVEEVRARGASRGGVASSKTLFKGEVEMKRTSSRGSMLFKPAVDEEHKREAKDTMTRVNSSGHVSSFGPSPRSPQLRNLAPLSRVPTTLAADTPVKGLVKREDDILEVVMESPDKLLFMNQAPWNQGDEMDREEGIIVTSGTILAEDTPVKKRLRG